MIHWIYILPFIKSDISNDMFIAVENMKHGKIQEARRFYNENVHLYGDMTPFRNKYINFLLQVGEYKTIINKYEHLDIESVHKAKECNDIMNTNNYKNISKLIEVSEYNPVVYKACIKEYLVQHKYRDADNYVKKAMAFFPSDMDFKRLQAHLECLQGDLNNGIRQFRGIREISTADSLEQFYKEYHDMKGGSNGSYNRNNSGNTGSNGNYNSNNSSYNSNNNNKWLELYHKINRKSLVDDYYPSVYTKLKYDVLYEYLKHAVDSKQKDFTSYALNYHKQRNNDESKYFVIMSYILSGNVEKAKKELAGCKFIASKYTRYIQDALRQKEEERRNEERRREQRRKEERSRTHQPAVNGNDFLGYYKLLGVDKSTPGKEIKKAYVKLVKKQKSKKKTEKEQEEWNALHSKYNQALDVLCDEKKRELYDQGVNPDQPNVPQHNYQQFNGFQFNNEYGAFDDFFSNFGNPRFTRGSRRTQYFYF